MYRWKRSFCAMLAAFLLILSPTRAYATSVAVTLSVGSYAVECLLAACGILGGTAVLTALIGSWDSADSYYSLGEQNKLGSYAQRIYDRARDTAEGAAEQFQQLEEALIALMTSAWGKTVAGVRALIADLKEFLKSCIGYGAAQTWHIPAVPIDQIWNETEWSSVEFYPLPTGSFTPFFTHNSSYTLFLSTYTTTGWAGVMNVRNAYYNNTLDIFGIYSAAGRVLTTYSRNAQAGTYAEYKAYLYSAYVYEDGSFKYSVDSTSYYQASALLCDPADAALLPFPVFTTAEDAAHYAETGEALNTYVGGTIPMEVEVFREDVAAGTVSDTLVFPETAESAAEKLETLERIYADAQAAELEQTLADAGLTIVITDAPDLDMPSDKTDTDADHQAVVDAIEALPGAIADSITDSIAVDASEAQEQLSLPAMIAEKFPFCIPFDVIHLIQALAAEKEVPRFELPLKFDYLDFHYDETFVIDLSAFDPAIQIFRVMLDLLFCAGLISVTRKLIRG